MSDLRNASRPAPVLALTQSALASADCLRHRQIALVEDQQPRRAIEVEFVQNRVHRVALARPLRIARIDDVYEEIGLLQLLQRRAERVDEIFGKVGYESNGIRQTNVRIRL